MVRPWQDGSDQLEAGDIVFFDGTGFLSDGIKVVTDSNLSHAAMVFPLELLPPGSQWHITESTIANGKSGPQLNPFDDRAIGYKGSVWVAKLDPKFKASINWPAVWQCALHKMGHDKYNVAEIGDYLLRFVPIVNDLPEIYKCNPNEEVCSEYDTILLQAGGALPGVNPNVVPPQKLAEMKIYSDLIQIKGLPADIRGFNTF